MTAREGSAAYPREWEAYGPFNSGGNDTTDYYRIGPVGTDEALCDVAGKERADFLVRVLNEHGRFRDLLLDAPRPDVVHGFSAGRGVYETWWRLRKDVFGAKS